MNLVTTTQFTSLQSHYIHLLWTELPVIMLSLFKPHSSNMYLATTAFSSPWTHEFLHTISMLNHLSKGSADLIPEGREFKLLTCLKSWTTGEVAKIHWFLHVSPFCKAQLIYGFHLYAIRHWGWVLSIFVLKFKTMPSQSLLDRINSWKGIMDMSSLNLEALSCQPSFYKVQPFSEGNCD